MERRLATILAADVVGYSRLMEADEEATARTLGTYREIIEGLAASHHGRVFGSAGDSVIAEFASPVEAVRCAVDIQCAIENRNAELPDERHMQFRVGVNLGDVMVDGDNLLGDGVNVAARLEGLSDPGGIRISGTVFDQVEGKLDLSFDDLGKHQVKNIAKRVRVYRVKIVEGKYGGVTASEAPLPLPDKPSIAVLPFDNMSGDAEQEYFSDGITEDIITELSRFRSLFVIARNSSFHYKGTSPKVQDVGRELGVQFIVEGSVRKAGNRVRITAQLVEAESGNHVWAERYDRELEDIFAVQDEVVREIATAVPGQLDSAAVQRAQRRPIENLTTYDYVLRGEWLLSQNFGDPEAPALFKKAIEIDPLCARAYTRLAAYHAYSVFAHGIAADEAVQLARSFAERALKIDPNDPVVQGTAAEAYILVGEHELARRHIEKAITLNPNDYIVMHMAGVVLAYLGDHEDALKWRRLASRQDPYAGVAMLEMYFDSYYMARRYEDAIESIKGWRDPPPHMLVAIAAAYAQADHMDDARAVIEQFERTRPSNWDAVEVAYAHVRMCAQPEDRDHWLEGYRKAGIEV